MGSTRSPVEIESINGARLAFQRFGDDDRPVIVLVAGGASAMEWWDIAFCERLAAGDATSGTRCVVRYDLRDTGQSQTAPPGEAEYTGSDLVDDLAALVGHVSARPAHVAGLSMGGAIVQRLALRRPELVATITLMSTTPIGGVDTPLPPPAARITAGVDEASVDDPDDEASVAAHDDATAVADAFVAAERLYSGSIPVDEARIRRIAAAIVGRSGPPTSADNHWLIADGPQATTDIAAITAPTLVRHGSDDPLFPLPPGEALAATIPGARLSIVPGMGHQFPPPPTWPQIVDELLRHTA